MDDRQISVEFLDDGATVDSVAELTSPRTSGFNFVRNGVHPAAMSRCSFSFRSSGSSHADEHWAN